MAEHDHEARCACGNEWRVRLEYDDDAMATCLACGADTFDLTDIDEVYSAGRDVEWNVSEEGQSCRIVQPSETLRCQGRASH